MVVCFLEGLIGGLVPTWVEGCRTNPAIFGIANAFSAGVFMSISLMHIMPEEIEGWKGWIGSNEPFPLPECLCFAGYTLLLILDKVLFDSHALFDEPSLDQARDPADAKFEKDVRSSIAEYPKNPTEE